MLRTAANSAAALPKFLRSNKRLKAAGRGAREGRGFGESGAGGRRSFQRARRAVGQALYDADGLYKTKQEQLAKLNQAQQALSTLADQRLANHAAADARAAGLELRLGDVSRTLVEAEQRFTERTAHAARLNDALVVAKSNLEVLETNYAMLQRKFDAETARTAQLGKDLDELRQQRDADQGKLRALNIKIGVQESALEDAKSARDAYIRRSATSMSKRLRELERAARAKNMKVCGRNSATLQGALDAARRRCEALESELSQARAGRGTSSGTEAEENASLRQGVSEIGAAIARLAPPALAADGEARDANLEMTNQTGT